MAKNKKFTVGKRRRRTNKTNYRSRLILLKSKKTRLVIRTHLNNTLIQLVNFDPKGDKVLSTAHSKELEKLGWKFHRGNIPTAYLTGLLIGKKAKKLNVNDAITDFGNLTVIKYSRIYAALKGAIDAGIKIPNSGEIFPSDEVIKGFKIKSYYDSLQKDVDKKTNQFSKYKKNNLNASEMENYFNEIKNKILNN